MRTFTFSSPRDRWIAPPTGPNRSRSLRLLTGRVGGVANQLACVNQAHQLLTRRLEAASALPRGDPWGKGTRGRGHRACPGSWGGGDTSSDDDLKYRTATQQSAVHTCRNVGATSRVTRRHRRGRAGLHAWSGPPDAPAGRWAAQARRGAACPRLARMVAVALEGGGGAWRGWSGTYHRTGSFPSNRSGNDPRHSGCPASSRDGKRFRRPRAPWTPPAGQAARPGRSGVRR